MTDCHGKHDDYCLEKPASSVDIAQLAELAVNALMHGLRWTLKLLVSESIHLTSYLHTQPPRLCLAAAAHAHELAAHPGA